MYVSASQSQKKALDLLEQELHAFMSHSTWMSGTKLGFFAGAVSDLSH